MPVQLCQTPRPCWWTQAGTAWSITAELFLFNTPAGCWLGLVGSGWVWSGQALAFSPPLWQCHSFSFFKGTKGSSLGVSVGEGQDVCLGVSQSRAVPPPDVGGVQIVGRDLVSKYK